MFLYTGTQSVPTSTLWLAILCFFYAAIVHSLAHKGKPLPPLICLGLDSLLVAALCLVSGGVDSPTHVYFYGIILIAAIRFGLIYGFVAAFVCTLLTGVIYFLSPHGDSSWAKVLLSPAIYAFLIAVISGMFAYERSPQEQRIAPERSRAERLLSFHRALLSLELDELLQQIADEIVRLVPCHGAAVLLIDFQRKRTDRVAASEHFPVPSAHELNASLTNGILHQALEQGTVLIESGDQIRTQMQTTPQMQEWAQHNLVIIRLNAQYPLGCIVLGDKDGGFPFEATDIQLLTLVAEDTATLIEKAWELEDARNIERSHRDSLRMIIGAQEQERRREVEEWDERFGQKLFQIIKDFRPCQEVVGQRLPELKERVEHIAAELDSVAAVGRHFSNEIHPIALDDSGLIEALREYVAGVQAQGGFTVTLQTPSQLPQLSNDTNIAVFRITQEALRNVRQHAQAHNVHITFTQEQSGVSLLIKDDGQGFDTEERVEDGQYGLLYMHQRVRACGGAFHVSSTRGQGTEIRVDFPAKNHSAPLKLTQPI
jgi:signal transduction histidine kinase